MLLFTLPYEQFSFECHKTKTKAVTLDITLKNTNYLKNQQFLVPKAMHVTGAKSGKMCGSETQLGLC